MPGEKSTVFNYSYDGRGRGFVPQNRYYHPWYSQDFRQPIKAKKNLWTRLSLKLDSFNKIKNACFSEYFEYYSLK